MGERSFSFMKRAVIIANGKMENSPQVASTIREAELIIAADGGVHNCDALGVQPDVIIGDLDSMGQDEVRRRQAAGVVVARYPTHKDETDLELALQFALKDEAREVVIIGALGARWDMTIANVLLTAHARFREVKIRILDGTQELALLRPGEHLRLRNRAGDQISLIPLAGDAYGITTHGLEYPLNNETLRFGSPRGVSNVIIQAQAEVFFTEGLLLCISDKRGK